MEDGIIPMDQRLMQTVDAKQMIIWLVLKKTS
jgi:hypothetical protein